MSGPIKGSCLCGAVKLTINVLPKDFYVCHCTDCRQHTGTVAAYLLDVPMKDMELTGELKEFSKKAASGRETIRSFCPTCGSPVWDFYSQPEKREVHAGLFPPGSIPNPSIEIYLRNAEKWEVPIAGVPAHKDGGGS